MKRLTMLVALILCVTIGGVYAAWIYPGNEEVKNHVSQTISLQGDDSAGRWGSYALTHNLSKIEIAPDNQDDKNVTLDYAYTNQDDTKVELTITFTAESNAGSVKEYGLETYIYFGIENDRTFTDIHGTTKSIFAFAYGKDNCLVIKPTNYETALQAGEYIWTEVSARVFSVTIELDFDDVVAINGEFALPNLTDYYNFVTALGNKHDIGLHMHATSIKPVV